MQDQRLGQQQTLVVKLDDYFMPVVSDDHIRTTKKLKALGLDIANYTILTYRVRTSAKPRPHITAWPFSTSFIYDRPGLGG